MTVIELDYDPLQNLLQGNAVQVGDVTVRPTLAAWFSMEGQYHYGPDYFSGFGWSQPPRLAKWFDSIGYTYYER